jgi:hypothetical protein
MVPVLLVFCILQSSLVAQESTEGLPELTAFLKNVRAHLRSDRLLQSQYTFKLKESVVQLDKKGNPEKSDVNEYEVYPSLEENLTYMRHMSKNGAALSPREIERQDRKQDKKLGEREQRLEKEGVDERTRRLSKEAEEKRKEDVVIDELFHLYDISIAGRNVIDGYSAIRLGFRPRPDYKPSTREGKILAKLAGQAWFCEEDQQLIRVEVELIDNLSFGLGVLARLSKGAKGVLLRQRVNNEIWLPAEARFSGTARLLLLKGLRVEMISEFSDYRKFTIDTSIKFRIPKNPQ